MSSNDQLIIFDTTLRDGEQSPGASMTKDEKIRIARALEKMRVDVIEAGFPIASPGDFEAVRAVAEVIKDSTVCGLARALEQDIDRWEQQLPRLKYFILPGGVKAGALLHVARTVCRRAERNVVSILREADGLTLNGVISYLNRLSDLLFVAARLVNHKAGVEEAIWQSDPEVNPRNCDAG